MEIETKTTIITKPKDGKQTDDDQGTTKDYERDSLMRKGEEEEKRSKDGNVGRGKDGDTLVDSLEDTATAEAEVDSPNGESFYQSILKIHRGNEEKRVRAEAGTQNVLSAEGTVMTGSTYVDAEDESSRLTWPKEGELFEWELYE